MLRISRRDVFVIEDAAGNTLRVVIGGDMDAPKIEALDRWIKWRRSQSAAHVEPQNT